MDEMIDHHLGEEVGLMDMDEVIDCSISKGSWM